MRGRNSRSLHSDAALTRVGDSNRAVPLARALTSVSQRRRVGNRGGVRPRCPRGSHEGYAGLWGQDTVGCACGCSNLEIAWRLTKPERGDVGIGDCVVDRPRGHLTAVDAPRRPSGKRPGGSPHRALERCTLYDKLRHGPPAIRAKDYSAASAVEHDGDVGADLPSIPGLDTAVKVLASRCERVRQYQMVRARQSS